MKAMTVGIREMVEVTQAEVVAWLNWAPALLRANLAGAMLSTLVWTLRLLCHLQFDANMASFNALAIAVASPLPDRGWSARTHGSVKQVAPD